MSIHQTRMLKIAGVIFAILALGPLLRLILGLDVIIGNFHAPKYLSVLAVLTFVFLAYLYLRASRP